MLTFNAIAVVVLHQIMIVSETHCSTEQAKECMRRISNGEGPDMGKQQTLGRYEQAFEDDSNMPQTLKSVRAAPSAVTLGWVELLLVLPAPLLVTHSCPAFCSILRTLPCLCIRRSAGQQRRPGRSAPVSTGSSLLVQLLHAWALSVIHLGCQMQHK
jgi:hypothetical protein